jgi:hypothetical protein
MKRLFLLLCAGALALAGCVVVMDKSPRLPDDGGFNPDVVTPPRPTAPNVFVSNGYLVVDQEPIRLWRKDVGSDGRVAIVWALSARSETKWLAPDRTVTFEPQPPGLDCKVRGAGLKILACSFQYRSRAKYKYTLTAQDGNIVLPPLDPYIVNME